MITKPDFNAAALKATELLIANNVTETPVNPLPMLLKLPGVRVMPFIKAAAMAGIERNELVQIFGTNQDAATFRMNMPGLNDIDYVVVYNMRLPFEIIWRGIARELGHIVLGHDGTKRPADVRFAEAMCFAHHLLCPRPVIQHIIDSGLPLTMNVLTNTTGCAECCVEDMQQTPGTSVPPEINRKIREMFSPHINEYINFHRASHVKDHSPLIDLGTYMNGYEE